MPDAKDWNDDTIRALTLYKRPLGPLGVWAVNAESLRSRTRCSLATMVEVSKYIHPSIDPATSKGPDATQNRSTLRSDRIGTLLSLSLEVQLHRHANQDTLDVFPMDTSSIIGLSKLLRHRFDRRKRSIPVEWRWRRIGRELLPATLRLYGKSATKAYGFILGLRPIRVFVNRASQRGHRGLFFAVVMHLRGLLDVPSLNFAESKLEKKQARGRKIGDSIDGQCRLSSLAVSLEETFPTVILVQPLTSALLPCVEGTYRTPSNQISAVPCYPRHVSRAATHNGIALHARNHEWISIRTEVIGTS
ncbi:hypothetical protein KM043_006100 [Ampulex compressa]|nr:hypothetical protein KM043_006100 [Ampulex compressa]